jgi:hypothetical protein
VTTLQGHFCLSLRVRRCHQESCPRYHQPYRPEEEGRWALPYGEYSLDVIALVGTLRYRHHHSLAELHQALRDRGMVIGERTVLNLLARYEELVSLHLSDRKRLQKIFAHQTSAILSLDGLRPDVGQDFSLVTTYLISLGPTTRWNTPLVPCATMSGAPLVENRRRPALSYEVPSERLLPSPANATPSKAQNSGNAISHNGECCVTKWRVAMKLVVSNTVSESLLWSISQPWRKSCASNQCGPSFFPWGNTPAFAKVVYRPMGLLTLYLPQNDGS